MCNSRMLISILALAFLIACGGSNEKIKLKIEAGFVSSPEKIQIKGASNTSDCYQDEIFLVTHDPINKIFLDRKPIRLRTQLAGTNELCAGIAEVSESSATNVSSNISNAITCLSASRSTIDEPLEITFSKGVAMEVGIVGTFYPAVDADMDGHCDKIDGTSYTLNSYSILGHTLIPVDYQPDDKPYPLQLNVIKSTPDVDYSMTIGNIPSVQDWVKLERILSPAKLIEIRYLLGSNGQFLIHQKINQSGSISVIAPHLFPLQLIFKESSSGNLYSYIHSRESTSGTSITACKMGAADCTASSNYVTGNYQITTY